MRFRNLLLSILVSLCLLSTANAQSKYKVAGYAEKGGLVVRTSPTVSYIVQQSFPNCTITVYLSGTLTLATIYANPTGTIILSNPFTAASDAGFEFYANPAKYDIKFSGTGIPTPFTLPNVSIPYTAEDANNDQRITKSLQWGNLAPQNAKEGTPWLSPSVSNISVSPRAVDRTLALTATVAWEGIGVGEPDVYKWNDFYYLTYRGNEPGGVGWAKSQFKKGPWVKQATSAPIIGQGAMGLANAQQPSTLLDNGAVYIYVAEGVSSVGDLKVFKAANPANLAALTYEGVALTHTSTKRYWNSSIIKDTLGISGFPYVMAVETTDNTSTHFYTIEIYGAYSPIGPFVFRNATSGLYVSTLLGGPVDNGATVSGPKLVIENGKYTLLYHRGTTAAILPSDIFRAVTSDLINYVQDPYPFIIRTAAREFDQAGDCTVIIDDDGIGVLWQGGNNTVGQEDSVLYYAPGIRGLSYYDGVNWVVDSQYQPNHYVLGQKIIGPTTQSFIDFEHLRQDYNSLEIEVQGRGTDVSQLVNCQLRLNGDNTANYYSSWIRTIGNAGTGVQGINEELGATFFGQLGLMPSGAIPFDEKGFTKATIANYATTGYKYVTSVTFASQGNATLQQFRQEMSGVYKSTGPINKITLFPGLGTTFATGTIVTIYGVR